MGIRDLKAEARHKLALNVHQAIIVYTIEFVIVYTLIALIALACMCLQTASVVAAVVMLCYGIVLFLVALIGCGMVDFAMVDYYLASYKCKPYNIRRLGETLARGGLTEILKLNLIRTLLGFLLLLCLIVPGVVFFVRTSIANHLLIANSKMKAGTALKASNKVMAGRTGEYLALSCSFIGWWMLGILTLGFGFVFILPYMYLAKTVYYKRKLQGDKAQYVSEPQPLSPAPSAPHENYAEGGFMPSPKAKGKQNNATQKQGEAPIDTLTVPDIEQMNEAVRDVTGVEVREVVIPSPSPASAKADDKSDTVVSVEAEVQSVEPIKVDTFTETVNTLTTQEIAEADVVSRRMNEIISEHNEVKNVDAFDDFMNDFGVPKQAGEFKPMTRSKDKVEHDKTERVVAEPRQVRPDREPPRRPLARDNAAQGADRAAENDRQEESRADRIRRERQERIKNMRK